MNVLHRKSVAEPLRQNLSHASVVAGAPVGVLISFLHTDGPNCVGATP